VRSHCFRQPGQTPPVSNVFHTWRQLHIHRSLLRGVQPHLGQRMRPAPPPDPFSWSSMPKPGSAGACVERAPESTRTSAEQPHRSLCDESSSRTHYPSNAEIRAGFRAAGAWAKTRPRELRIRHTPAFIRDGEETSSNPAAQANQVMSAPDGEAGPGNPCSVEQIEGSELLSREPRSATPIRGASLSESAPRPLP
jgi:hypothetical protein